MNASWNFLRLILAAGLGLAAFTACQDRGQFQSKTYSKAELDAFLAKQKPADAAPDKKEGDDKVDGGGVSKFEPTPDGKGKTAGTVQPPKPSPLITPGTGIRPGVTVVRGKGGTTQLFFETTGDMLSINRDEMIKHPIRLEAKERLLALFVEVKGKVPPLALTLDAMVKIGNALFQVHVVNSRLNYDEKGTVPALTVQMVTDGTNNAVADASKVINVFAVCEDKTCGTIHLRFDFAAPLNETVAAIAIYKYDGTNLVFDKSNLGGVLPTVREFEDKRKEEAEKAEREKAAAGGGSETPDQKAAKERLEKERAEKAAAEQAAKEQAERERAEKAAKEKEEADAKLRSRAETEFGTPRSEPSAPPPPAPPAPAPPEPVTETATSSSDFWAGLKEEWNSMFPPSAATPPAKPPVAGPARPPEPLTTVDTPDLNVPTTPTAPVAGPPSPVPGPLPVEQTEYY